MTLLAPLSAIVAVALAAPLLLLLYFLKLRRRRLRVSSTMLWERAVDDLQVNEPFRWLRSSWLLVLQMLALLCLALALGRPTIPGGGLTADRVLLLIDRSASMSAADSPSGGTRLDEAIEAANEIVDDLPHNGAAQVVVYASDAVALTPMTTDRGAIRRALASIEPTDQPGALDDALRLAAALTAPGDESGASAASVLLLTDGGDEILAGPGLMPEAITLRRVGPAPTQLLDNLGIVSVATRRDFKEPTRLAVFVRVQSTLDREAATRLSVRLDGAVTQRLGVTVPGSSGDAPGSATATISLEPGDARVLRLTLDREDSLASDNAVSIVLPESPRPRVLLVTPGDSVSWVVGDIIETLAGDGLRVVRGSALEEMKREPAALDAFDLVVLDRVGTPDGVRTPTLSFGVPVSGLTIWRDDSIGADRFLSWQRTHPVMRSLTLEGVSISTPAWFRMESGDDSTTGPGADAGGTQTLARGRAGPLIIETTDGHTRRIGVAFEPAASTWPVEISFALFVAQAFESLALAQERGDAVVRTGDTPVLRMRSGLAPVLTGPAELSGRPAEEGVQGSKVRTVFAPASLVGEYSSSDGEVRLAVGLLDAGESGIALSDRIVIGGRPVVAAASGEGRREVWVWFVLAALALLTVEWLLFTLRSRV